MILLFLPEWLTGTSFLIGVFGFLTLIAAAIVVVVARGRTDVATIQIERNSGLEAIIKIRDTEKADLILELAEANKQLKDVEEELESLTAEHRTLVAIDIGKLMEYWSRKEDMEAQIMDLERQIRVLRKLKDGDTKSE